MLLADSSLQPQQLLLQQHGAMNCWMGILAGDMHAGTSRPYGWCDRQQTGAAPVVGCVCLLCRMSNRHTTGWNRSCSCARHALGVVHTNSCAHPLPGNHAAGVCRSAMNPNTLRYNVSKYSPQYMLTDLHVGEDSGNVVSQNESCRLGPWAR